MTFCLRPRRECPLLVRSLWHDRESQRCKRSTRPRSLGAFGREYCRDTAEMARQWSSSSRSVLPSSDCQAWELSIACSFKQLAGGSRHGRTTTTVLNVELGFTRWPNQQQDNQPSWLPKKIVPSAKSSGWFRYDISTYTSSSAPNAASWYSKCSWCGPFHSWVSAIRRGLGSTTESYTAMKLFSPTKPQTTPAVIPEGEAPSSVGQVNPFLLPPQQAHLAWALGQPLSMYVYLSTSPNGDVFSRQWTSGWREDQDKNLPSLVWSNITFGDWNDHRTEYFDLALPEVHSHSYHVYRVSLESGCSTERVSLGRYLPYEGGCKPGPIEFFV